MDAPSGYEPCSGLDSTVGTHFAHVDRSLVAAHPVS
jgi:hypothetical protein